MQRFHVLLDVNAAEQRFAHDSSVAVKHIGGRERHDPQRKRSGLAVCVEVDVAVFRAGHFENLLGQFNALLVVAQGFHVDADDLAALRLDALVQRVQVIQLLHAGLAAAEPEVYNGERIVGKQAVIHVVAVEILSLKLRESAVLFLVVHLICRAVSGKRRDLLLDLPNLLRVRLERLVFLGGELVLRALHGAHQHVAVIAAEHVVVHVFIHGHEYFFPERVVGKEDVVFNRQKLLFRLSFHHVGTFFHLFVHVHGGLFFRLFFHIRVHGGHLFAAGGHGEGQQQADHQRDYSIRFHCFCSFSLFSF